MRLGVVSSSGAPRVAALIAVASDARVLWATSSIAGAVARTSTERPDAVLVDARALGGSLAALVATGTPIVILRTAGDDDGGAVYEAMSDGAAYALELPAETDASACGEAMRKIRRACGTPARGSTASTAGPSPLPLASGPAIVALGASTGGPGALREVLMGLGRPARCAVLVVQHLEPEYVPGLATWLTHELGLDVRLSSHGAPLEAGTVTLASTDEHLVLGPTHALEHRPALPGEIHHPSVDALFESLAGSGRSGVAALLTGMGRDGAAGLLALRRAGWSTVAQDEASCSVYGMPRAACELDAAMEILPLDRIGAWIARAVGRSG